MTITVDIEIEDQAWTAAAEDAEALVWRAAQAVLDAHEDIEGQGIVILLTDDDSVQALNRDFVHCSQLVLHDSRRDLKKTMHSSFGVKQKIHNRAAMLQTI